MHRVKDIVDALSVITGGRTVKDMQEVHEGNHPFVINKSSGIQGKDVLEIPGLIWGDPERPVRRIAVCMTMTELVIELAGATDIDAVVAHHPLADAASCGGVTLKDYLDLYQVAGLECHEAFHGIHPGIAYLHGHQVRKADISYGGVHGNIMFVGTMLDAVNTLGGVLDRLQHFMAQDQEAELLNLERKLRFVPEIKETSVETQGFIHLGSRDSKIKEVLHIFPHTGFSPEHLRQAIADNPEVDTVIASISRVYEGHPLIETARELGLNFIVGNCHVLEILENGLPLAFALDHLLPDAEVLLFRDRVTSTPIRQVGNPALQAYASQISQKHLIGATALDKDDA